VDGELQMHMVRKRTECLSRTATANKSALQLRFLSGINLEIAPRYAKVPDRLRSFLGLAIEFPGTSKTHPQARNGG
jgi:hypothetical protein